MSIYKKKLLQHVHNNKIIYDIKGYKDYISNMFEKTNNLNKCCKIILNFIIAIDKKKEE